MTSTGHSVSGNASEVWTIDAILRWTRGYFERQGLPAARLDAELLLAHVLQCDRVRLYTHFDQPLTAGEREAFRALVKRRAAHEPVAYLCGHREFYGRDFAVDAGVLIPRPETEHVIEAALAWAGRRPESPAPLRLLDVGCGSGALAVTLAAELPGAQVTAVDISPAALKTTAENAQRHGVAERVSCVASDLLAQVQGTFDIVVSNPPYVAECERADLPADVARYEPHLALFGGGDDGLRIIERLIAQIEPHMARPGLFLCEIGYRQGAAVRALLESRDVWHEIDVLPDLQGHPRVVVAHVRDGKGGA